MNSPGPKRRFFSTGTAVVLGLGLVLLLGWFAYQPMIPPVWLHDLAADIALRAAADPDAPLPRDSREASPRGLADSPYICVAKIVQKPWDHIVAVTSDEDLRAHPVLTAATWPKNNLEAVITEMARDDRYQILVLLKDNTVIDAEMFYTFWADLESVARPEGYTPEQAIFTAASKNGVYVVSAADDAPPESCR